MLIITYQSRKSASIFSVLRHRGTLGGQLMDHTYAIFLQAVDPSEVLVARRAGDVIRPRLAEFFADVLAAIPTKMSMDSALDMLCAYNVPLSPAR